MSDNVRCSLARSWRPALCEIGRRPTGPTGTNSSMSIAIFHLDLTKLIQIPSNSLLASWL